MLAYNYFSPHMGLDDKTQPAATAAEMQFTSWVEIGEKPAVDGYPANGTKRLILPDIQTP